MQIQQKRLAITVTSKNAFDRMGKLCENMFLAEKLATQLLPLFFLGRLRLGRLCDTLSSSRGSGIGPFFGQALGFCAGGFDRVHFLHRRCRRSNRDGLCFGSGGLHGLRRGIRRNGAVNKKQQMRIYINEDQ